VYGVQNQVVTPASSQAFTQVYHNNNLFKILKTKDIEAKSPQKPEDVECPSCRLKFNLRMPIVPYDVALSHKEKWQYRNPSNHNEFIDSGNRQTTKYYHVQKDCIFKRFPYFNEKFLERGNVALTASHKAAFKRELNIDIDIDV
jgi:hypothetical protein